MKIGLDTGLFAACDLKMWGNKKKMCERIYHLWMSNRGGFGIFDRSYYITNVAHVSKYTI